LLIAFRKAHPTLTTPRRLDGRGRQDAFTEAVTYHGTRVGDPDWGFHSHSLAVQFHGEAGDGDVYVIANAYWEPLTFALPPDVPWKRVVDTSRPAPQDIVPEREAEILTEPSCVAGPRSVIVLFEARA